jgi:hypothetical protein
MASRHTSVDYSDQDYLRDDLLDGDEGEFPSPVSTFRRADSVHLPPQRGNSDQDVSSNRLVIAIDYGTTFTGKRYHLVVPQFN